MSPTAGWLLLLGESLVFARIAILVRRKHSGPALLATIVGFLAVVVPLHLFLTPIPEAPLSYFERTPLPAITGVILPACLGGACAQGLATRLPAATATGIVAIVYLGVSVLGEVVAALFTFTG